MKMFFLGLIFLGNLLKLNGQTIYVATDTFDLEIGSGWNLSPEGYKNGVWEYPYDNNPNNKIKFRATFKNDTLSGPFEAFWPNGNKKAKINFEKGLKSGEVFYYFEDGKLKYRMNYLNDLLDGEFFQFYKSGRMQKMLNFKKGLLDGTCQAFEDEGSKRLIAVGTFSEGKPHGRYVNYVDKKRRIEEYFENGYPTEGRKFFLNDKLVGEFILDRLRMEFIKDVTYKDGIIIKEGTVLESLRKHFMYGKYLFLPENFQ
jgi:hypothetical protein